MSMSLSTMEMTYRPGLLVGSIIEVGSLKRNTIPSKTNWGMTQAWGKSQESRTCRPVSIAWRTTNGFCSTQIGMKTKRNRLRWKTLEAAAILAQRRDATFAPQYETRSNRTQNCRKIYPLVRHASRQSPRSRSNTS